MKRSVNFCKTLMAFTVAGSSLLLTSCNDDDMVGSEMDNTISGIVIESNNFTTLEAGLGRANLVDALRATGPFTVFAPDNDAFAASGINTTVLNALPLTRLDSILKYHVLTSDIPSGSVPAGPNAKVTTLSGDSVFVTRNAAGVFINGVRVKTADVDASNGTIHVVSNVLIPPGNRTIVNVALEDTSLSYLVAAVLRASEGTTNVASVLSSTNGLTVFAPTNNAFRAANLPTIASIQAADPALLTSILTHHVIGARVFSSDLTEGLQAPTLGGENVTITLSGGAKVKGAANATASNIIATNIMARNGVVHKIDQVLLPTP
ncbi:MAG: fasciclin domain-containing protein [Chitinophagaceae bacterium]